MPFGGVRYPFEVNKRGFPSGMGPFQTHIRRICRPKPSDPIDP